MNVLINKETGEAQVYKYLTPNLNVEMGYYSEQYFRKKVRNCEKGVIETEKHILYLNCPYDNGNKGGYREKRTE